MASDMLSFLLLPAIALGSVGLLTWAVLSLSSGKRPEEVLPPTRALPRHPESHWANKLPAEATWLGPSEFETLSHLLDTLVPAFQVTPATSPLLDSLVKRELQEATFEASALQRQMPQLLRLPSESAEMARFFARSASDVDVARHFAIATQRHGKPADRVALRVVLRLLDTRLGGWLFGAGFIRFKDATFAARHRMLERWAASPLPVLRQLFQSLKRLGCSLFLGAPFPDDGGVRNPNWDILDYTPRCEAAGTQRRAALAEMEDDALKACVPREPLRVPPAPKPYDVVIVGSGAGGGVAASVLTQKGFRVAVVEKGQHFGETNFAQWSEMQAFENAFEDGGLLTNGDKSISVMAGSCVGGGTTINWSASFRLPPHVRREWIRNFGIDWLAEDLDASFAEVSKMMNINTAETHRHEKLHGCTDSPSLDHAVNKNNDFLVEGAYSLGMKCRAVPRNVKGCVDCGSCNFGCAYGAKQGTLKILRDAARTGLLTLIPNTTVDAVQRDRTGRATGVKCVREADGGARESLFLSAHAVIIAAGSINTPKILARSGLRHSSLGRNLSLHPVACVVGVFEGGASEAEDTGLDHGVSMGTYVCDGNVDFDGTGYGVVPETPPVHPLLLAIGMPWKSALLFKAAVGMYRRCGLFIGIARDHSSPSNRIKASRRVDDKTELEYALTSQDEQIVLEGIKLNMRLMRAAGARVLFPVNRKAKWFVDNPDDPGAFERYVRGIGELGVVPNETALFSAHQMSSCRMSAHGSGPFAGPVTPSGESREAKNLYVMDGSVLPTSLGINPMVTIMSVAHALSMKLAAKLRRQGDQG